MGLGIKLEPGSVVLTPGEVGRLLDHIARYRSWGDAPSLGALGALVGLGVEIRDILTNSTPLSNDSSAEGGA